jgi:membrane protein required for colicin V production
LLPAVVGVIYGFLNILFSIIAWALALGIALKLSSAFAPLLEGYIGVPLLRDTLAFLGLFVVSLVIFTVLGHFLVKLLGRTGHTAADRIFGFLFGGLLGGAIVLVMVFLAGFTSLPEGDWWRESRLIQPFQRASVWARRFLPDNVVEYHRYSRPVPPVNP